MHINQSGVYVIQYPIGIPLHILAISRFLA